jgi:hypothetical protein
MPLAIDGDQDLVQVPFVTGPRSAAAYLIGIILPELLTPATDRFVGDLDTTFEKDFLNVSVAQGEPIIEPDAMANDLRWKAVVFVSVGLGWRRHIGCLCGVRWVGKSSSLEGLCHKLRG